VGCSRTERREPTFPGRVLTEDPTVCHGVRDGTISLHGSARDARVRDAIIIGAGISGLAAARRLLRAGVTNILIVDKESAIGGQSRAGEVDGLRFPWAAHFVSSPHPRAAYLVELYRDLGLITGIADDGWPIVAPEHCLRDPRVYVKARGQWGHSDFPFPVADPHEVNEYRRFYTEMFHWACWEDETRRPAFGTPVALTTPDEHVRRLDRMTMRSYLTEQGYTSSLLLWYVNSRLINEYGTDVDHTSAWTGIHYWAATKSGFDELSRREHEESIFTWPEGNAFLAHGLARDLTPRQVRTETLAVQVRNRENWVDVTLLDVRTRQTETLRARHVIYAAPKLMVERIIPDLRSEGREEFRRCEYVPWITANAVVRHTPRAGDRPPAWDNIPFERGWSLGYVSEAHVSRRPEDYRGPTVLTFYGALYSNMNLERRELLEGGWEYWARLVVDELDRMHPGIAEDVTRMDIFKWGHAMPVPSPGYLWGPEVARMKRPLGRIRFAHTDVAGLGVFEEGVYRGIETAQEVLDELGVAHEDALLPGDWADP